MKLPFVVGALILSAAHVMVSTEPVEALVNEEEHHEYCWSNRKLCYANYRYEFFKLGIRFEFEQYCKAKSQGWLTTEGIFEGAEDLYRHNDPRDDWDAPKLTKEYERKIVHHALRDAKRDYPDCLDWDRFTNVDLV